MEDTMHDRIEAALNRAADWTAMSPAHHVDLAEELHQTRVTRNPHLEYQSTRTFGERLADRIASFGGSWKFIMLFFGILAAWTGLNSLVLAPRGHAFDPYPYIFLNLVLSTLAALQAPVIMMSQQRQATRDRHEALTDYRVNLKAEIEIRALHAKLDALRDVQWRELVQMQHEQIALLGRLIAPPGAPSTVTLPAT